MKNQNRCTVAGCDRVAPIYSSRCSRCDAIPTLLIRVRSLVVQSENVRGKAGSFLVMKALIEEIEHLAQYGIERDSDITLLEKCLAKVSRRWCKQHDAFAKLNAQRDEAIADAYANRPQ